MRTEVRARKANYNVYIADDGTEFESIFDCEAYEENKYKKAYENLPCTTFCLNDLYEDGGDYTYYKIFPIRNKEDIKIINTYLLKEGEFDDFLTEEYIGQSAFICETDSTVWLADGYTIEAMKDEIVSNLNRITNKVKAMEKEYLNEKISINNFHYFNCDNIEITESDLCNIVTSALNNSYGYGTYICHVRCGDVKFEFLSYSREGFVAMNCLFADSTSEEGFRDVFTVSIEREDGIFTVEKLKNNIKYIINNEKLFYDHINDGETIEEKLNKKLNMF